MTMLTSVLVANRGEIAVRIIRTLQSMGIRSLAVYSEADRNALHVQVADEAVLVGPADARSSYLRIDRIIEAALERGVDAIHPGYGFLSENAEFAAACEAAGLIFIGPTSECIALMGDKRAAKDAVGALGVPIVPGVHCSADDNDVLAQAESVGFPLIVKPAAGGGGKGMRVVREPGDVMSSVASARRESLSAFGDDSLLFERYIPVSRHVEVQVAGDGHGAVIHLGDRDCSLQRRHQKVIEEAPAPYLPDDARAGMRAHAVAIAESVNYRGVGTVEFIVDATDPSTYFFLEMNTRLQVEHPVTEAVTGVDLVELQVRVASGGGLGLTQDDVHITGHAVEARVYAEDGHHEFLPSSGTIVGYREPVGVRVDSGVREGDVVGTNYDPLLLKVIAHAPDRTAALAELDHALATTTVLGLAHNIGVLRALVRDDDVRSGNLTTALIGERSLGTDAAPPAEHLLVAAALLLANDREVRTAGSPFTDQVGWRVGEPAAVVTKLADSSSEVTTVSVTGRSTDATVTINDGEPRPASIATRAANDITLRDAGISHRLTGAIDATGPDVVVWVGEGGDTWPLHVQRPKMLARDGALADTDGELRSPMPGSVVMVKKNAGEAVSEGEVIAVIEAMKMEYPLVAPFVGQVESIAVSVGAQVTRGQIVAIVVPVEGAS